MTFDIVEMVMALEEGFGIEIADIDVENLRTVGDLHFAILKSMWRADTTARSAKEIWSALVSMFEDCGALPGTIKPETRLAALLGLD